MARILVIETDARQASLVKAIVLNHVGAQLEIVRSKDQAIAAIDADVPDLILLSALISPRDEEFIVAHLRTLDRADHLQTLTMPRLASSSDDDGSDGGLLRKFKRRRGGKPRASGCDPKVFAEEILGYLGRAEQIKADHAAVAEAERFAAEAEAERLRAASTTLESTAPAAAPIDIAPAAMEMPVVAAPAPEVVTAEPAVIDAPLVTELIPEPPAIEALIPEVEFTAPVVVDGPRVTETLPEPPAVEALTAEIEAAAPAVVEASLVAESMPEPPALEALTLESERSIPKPPTAEDLPAPVSQPMEAGFSRPLVRLRADPTSVVTPVPEVEPEVVPEPELVAQEALVAESRDESPPATEQPSADVPLAAAPVAAPTEAPQVTPHAPTPAWIAPLPVWPHPDDTPIGALPWGDQTPVAEDLRALLHGLRLPASLADLARADGCRIHRVRVAQLPGPATISDRRGDADDLSLESHAAWLDTRRGTPVASPQPRTPAGSR